MREGQVLEIDLLGKAAGEEVSFTPLLLVDGETVVTAADELGRASVTARVTGEAKGPKIRGFYYRPKSNYRRRWGHRQRYTTIEITGIKKA